MNTPVLLLEFFRMMEARKTQWRRIRDRLLQHVYILFYMQCSSPPPDSLLFDADSLSTVCDGEICEKTSEKAGSSDRSASGIAAGGEKAIGGERDERDEDKRASRINRKKEINFLMNSGDRMILEWSDSRKVYLGRGCDLHKCAVEYYAPLLDDVRANKRCVFTMQARLLIKWVIRGLKVRLSG
jgi:hypothetical protein